MSQFVDLVQIHVQSGDGGNGMVAWRREKYVDMGGPAGGNGGRGGSVYLEATHDLMTLLDFRFRKEFTATPGEKGASKKMNGRKGDDLVIKVPIGTLVRDIKGNVIADLTEEGQRVIVAEGGRGGRGNADLSSHGNRAPYYCEPGELGIERDLELELKLVADVGIVGLPNAGKSTLLSVLTAAKPKIADYPFTTLQPNLGVVQHSSGDGFVIADVPGLVEGASNGVGLGHKFLRHLERTRLLVHMADISSPDLESNIAMIGNELHLYSDRFEHHPQIIALNKCDLITNDEAEDIADHIWANLEKLLPNPQAIIAVIPVSCASSKGISELKNMLSEELSKLPADQQVHEIVEDTAAHERIDEGFQVERKKNKFYVYGTRIERLTAVTNMRSPEALQHLFHVLKAMGIVDALLEAGVQPGSEIIIGEALLTFGHEFT